MNRIPAVQNK